MKLIKNGRISAPIPVKLLMLSACLLHYGMDFRRVIRYCNNEYIGKHRNWDRVHRDLSPHIRKDDMDQIDRILFQGCPAQLQYELPCRHKLQMMRRGNQKTVSENMKEVRATMNKEEDICTSYLSSISFVNLSTLLITFHKA